MLIGAPPTPLLAVNTVYTNTNIKPIKCTPDHYYCKVVLVCILSLYVDVKEFEHVLKVICSQSVSRSVVLGHQRI